jgi:hypothetical protein
MKAHISRVTPAADPNEPTALLSTAISAALQAPLSKAVKVVRTIIPRQVRRMNFNKIIIEVSDKTAGTG